jgi:hypothetical protein
MKCPVLPVARRIGELWDAHSMAEDRKAEVGTHGAEQIDKLRIATEEMVSFERARSTSGALFQVAVASYAVRLLYENLLPPEKNRYTENIFDQVERLLESVALLLREKRTPEEFQQIESVINMYLDVDGSLLRPLQWLDDIQDLAKEYRQQPEDVEPASAAAAHKPARGKAVA